MGTVRSRKAHWLLALLVLRHDRATSREWFASTLWPDTDRSIALANLRTVLSELKQALGTQSKRIESPEKSTLHLNLIEAEVDFLQFESAVARAEFEKAIELYQGSLLDDCLEEWVYQERSRCEQDCGRAFQELAKQSKPSDATNLYRRWIELEPWRDVPRRSLMELLADSGNTNEALQVYREFAAYLKSESSAIPDEETTRLYLELRKGTRKSGVKPEVAASQIPRNLPLPLTSLIGLEDELLEAADRVRQNRLVTITGFGGIGKTRLARELAANLSTEFSDGVWFVPLDLLNEESLVDHQVASILGVQEKPNQPTLQSLISHLRSSRALLVLDNCEHVLSSSGYLSQSLLQNCGNLHILAISREPLGVMGEKVWRAAPLSYPEPAHLPGHPATLVRVAGSFDSVQLFLERAQTVDDRFELTAENAQRIAEICFYLEGIPLAIELAAACMRSMSIHQIAERVREPISLLNHGMRLSTPRQQTLGATIDWSYSFLSARECELLGHVAWFAGGWTLEAAESICGSQVATNLAHLVDKSLVVFQSDGRYKLLESVRQYAREREAGSTSPIQTKFVAYFKDLLHDLAPRARLEELVVKKLLAEEANIRQALFWAIESPELRPIGLQIATDWASYWFVVGRFSEGLRHIRSAIEHDSGGNVELRAEALAQAAALASATAQFNLALSLLTEALGTYRELDHKAGIARTSRYVGEAHDGLGHSAESLIHYKESYRIFHEIGAERDAALSSVLVGTAYSDTCNAKEAIEWIQRGYSYFQRTNESRGMSWTLNRWGNVYLDNGPEDQALAYFEDTLKNDLETGSFMAGYTLNNIATVYSSIGKFQEARDSIRHGFEVAEAHEDLRCRSGLYRSLSYLESRAGNHVASMEAAQMCFELTVPNDTNLDLINCLGSLAISLSGLGRFEEAAVMSSAALTGCKAWNINVPQVDQVRLDEAAEQVRQNLSQSAHSEFTAIGANLSLEGVRARVAACLTLSPA